MKLRESKFNTDQQSSKLRKNEVTYLVVMGGGIVDLLNELGKYNN